MIESSRERASVTANSISRDPRPRPPRSGSTSVWVKVITSPWSLYSAKPASSPASRISYRLASGWSVTSTLSSEVSGMVQC